MINLLSFNYFLDNPTTAIIPPHDERDDLLNSLVPAITPENIGNALVYVERMQVEYQISFMRRLLEHDKSLSKTPELKKTLERFYAMLSFDLIN